MGDGWVLLGVGSVGLCMCVSSLEFQLMVLVSECLLLLCLFVFVLMREGTGAFKIVTGVMSRGMTSCGLCFTLRGFRGGSSGAGAGTVSGEVHDAFDRSGSAKGLLDASFDGG